MRLRTNNLTRITAAIFFFLMLVAPAHGQFFSKKETQLLPEDKAFSATAVIEQGRLKVNWSIAEDYYMYRENFAVSSNTAGVIIGEIDMPEGVVENDPEFGEVEVYFYHAALSAPISANQDSAKVELVIKGLGCNKPVGVCYPPQTRVLTVDYQAGITTPDSNRNTTPEKSFWRYIITALGAGLLLSFTPCVLPMIPILAGVIAGQQNPSRLKSGWLSICYVAGTIVTYAIAGWVAGATGTQLQAHFQNPWVIGFVCVLLLLLAASLFGMFKIQLPALLQTRLNNTDVTSRSVSISTFVLGLISALVVGACVSPILIINLGAAISLGDPVLGASIMSAMALGMGLLLILFGFGAGWLLPRTGAWMIQIQVIFGFMVLGVAIYLASNFPVVPSLYLWAALLLIGGFYVWQLSESTPTGFATAGLRAAALATLLWGSMSLIGGATGGDDILRPLDSIRLTGTADGSSERSDLPFQTTTNLSGAKQLLQQAKLAGRPVLVDFYADWCPDCKRMHRTTFRQPAVAAALEPWNLVEIDVTETSDISEEVKKYFGVFGPPATLLINANGEEYSDLRQYGYLNEQDFLALLARARN